LLSEDEKELLKNKTINKDNLIIDNALANEKIVDEEMEENFLNLNDSQTDDAGYDNYNNKNDFHINSRKEKNLILKNKLSKEFLNSDKHRKSHLNVFIEKFKSLKRNILGESVEFLFENTDLNIKVKENSSTEDIKKNFVFLENESDKVDDCFLINMENFNNYLLETKEILKNCSENRFCSESDSAYN